MKLSDNFTLSELTKSGTAKRFDYSEQFTPPESVIESLTLLCKEVLQPIRDSLEKPITVSSGYRCPRLNSKIGGSSTSQHQKGEAADINLNIKGIEKNAVLLDEILMLWYDGKIQFDQLIIEFPDENDVPEWIHISYNPKRNRNEILKAEKNSLGKTYYTKLN